MPKDKFMKKVLGCGLDGTGSGMESVLYYTDDFADAWWYKTISEQVTEFDHVVVAYVDDCDNKKFEKSIKGIQEEIEKEFGVVLKLDRQMSKAGDEEDTRIMFVSVNDQKDKNFIIDLKFKSESFYGWVWAHVKELGQKISALILKHIPKKYIDINKGEVPIAFWRTASHGAQYDFRDLSCPKFETIKENYNPEVSEKIESLWSSNNPDSFGKIIIWVGNPGTGKTYAIRALAQEWFSRFGATVETVLDPEVMFESAKYMYSMVLSDPENDYMVKRIADRIKKMGKDKPEEEDKQTLRLIIIEDFAQLFAAECRQKEGFARFLNLGDGLIGQGLRLVFLLTANEKIDYFDDAVTRPGRCIQILHFDEFSYDDALVWLAKKGMDEQEAKEKIGSKKEKLTLAEMYTILHGKKSPKIKKPTSFGFG